MNLDRSSRIGPWPALEIRQMLRRVGAGSWDLSAMRAAFGMLRAEARRLLVTLSHAGDLMRDPARPHEHRWVRTPAGEACAEASLGRPLSRARADRILRQVLRRVGEINRKPYYLCRVTAVGVFGSYLTEDPVLDTLDLVVRLVPKPPAPGTSDEVFRPDRHLPYWRLQKLLPSHDWPQWRERHVELSLGAGLWHVVLYRSDHPLLQGERIRLVFLEQPGTRPPGSCTNDTPE